MNLRTELTEWLKANPGWHSTRRLCDVFEVPTYRMRSNLLRALKAGAIRKKTSGKNRLFSLWSYKQLEKENE